MTNKEYYAGGMDALRQLYGRIAKKQLADRVKIPPQVYAEIDSLVELWLELKTCN